MRLSVPLLRFIRTLIALISTLNCTYQYDKPPKTEADFNKARTGPLSGPIRVRSRRRCQHSGVLGRLMPCVIRFGVGVRSPSDLWRSVRPERPLVGSAPRARARRRDRDKHKSPSACLGDRSLAASKPEPHPSGRAVSLARAAPCCAVPAQARTLSQESRLQHRPTDLQVDDFYAFWFNFKSWRNFPVEDEEKARTPNQTNKQTNKQTSRFRTAVSERSEPLRGH